MYEQPLPQWAVDAAVAFLFWNKDVDDQKFLSIAFQASGKLPEVTAKAIELAARALVETDTAARAGADQVRARAIEECVQVVLRSSPIGGKEVLVKMLRSLLSTATPETNQ